MALERRTVIDARTVLEDGQIQVREATYIVDTDTGERIAGPRYYRYVVAPGDDTSNHPEAVVRLTEVEWTPDVVSTYQEARRRRLTNLPADPTPGLASPQPPTP